MKRILLIATGGTIASSEDGNGLSPTLTGADLARAVPEIDNLCELGIVQPMNIDSTNMRPSDWMRIRDCIAEHYDDYDGFVVLHGTDTMSYTAAALSYLIQNSPKPIVLTGSQKPMSNPFTDAKLNLYQSLLYAADDRSSDVCVVFGGAVIAGTRARKQRTMSFNAFDSVNVPPLAYIRNNRIVRSGNVPSYSSAIAQEGTAKSAPGTPSASAAVQAAKEQCADHSKNPAATFYNKLSPRVMTLKLTPGLDPTLFETLKPSIDALIIETFGIGGIPEYGINGPSYREAIFDWVDSGRCVVMTTQVPEEGLDLGVYEVGRAYAEHDGILKGDDMTTEALVAKTMWVLGETRDPQRIKELFYREINHDRIPAC